MDQDKDAMPLANDLGFDTISSFERAARERFTEAELLARHNNPLGAIYLYGYTVEMIIKAAYFRNQGHDSYQLITERDRRRAMNEHADVLLGSRIANSHDFEKWALLLVGFNRALPRPTYDQAFSIDLVNFATRAYENWRPEMRYRAMLPPASQVEIVRSSAVWFQRNDSRM